MKKPEQIDVFVANSEKGQPKVKVGSYEWIECETLQEVMDNYDENEIVARFNYGMKVKLASEVRTPSKKGKSDLLAGFSQEEKLEALEWAKQKRLEREQLGH